MFCPRILIFVWNRGAWYMCKIAEGLGICVHELRADEESYAVSVSKDTLAKLIVVSEINNVELEELINCILEKGIEEHGFYA